jgi:hypothetical protein
MKKMEPEKWVFEKKFSFPQYWWHKNCAKKKKVNPPFHVHHLRKFMG